MLKLHVDNSHEAGVQHNGMTLYTNIWMQYRHIDHTTSSEYR